MDEILVSCLFINPLNLQLEVEKIDIEIKDAERNGEHSIQLCTPIQFKLTTIKVGELLNLMVDF